MKYKSLVLGLAAFSFVALAVGCNKQETAPPAASAQETRALDQTAADTRHAAEAPIAHTQKAADPLIADAAQEQAEAMALKQIEADKADQALQQAAAAKVAAEQLPAEKQTQPAAAPTKVQSLINTATSLASEKKWADVLTVLAQLGGEQLTSAQQAVVQGLKSDAQKQAGAAVAGKATTEAGNALGGLLQPQPKK